MHVKSVEAQCSPIGVMWGKGCLSSGVFLIIRPKSITNISSVALQLFLCVSTRGTYERRESCKHRRIETSVS
ncbi:hypothetical protein TNCV_2268061 [Trichonephila clavipes]|nr:hypothetical protein TNCV_2268061 [Trichonephila clavipes]